MDPAPESATTAFDDWETRRIVRSQEKLENALLLLCIFYTVLSCAWQMVQGQLGILEAVVMTLCAYVFLSLFYAALKRVVFRPIRAFRYGRCVRRLFHHARSMIKPVLIEAWTFPAPGLIALDPLRRLLFVECRRTGYHGLLLRPDQIVDIAVEREQIIDTTTTHGPQMIFAPFESLGLLSGGQSHSTATVYDTAVLEIAFVRSEQVGVERVTVDFGGRRRVADDWRLSVNRMRNSVD
jgi:hypothetical protein